MRGIEARPLTTAEKNVLAQAQKAIREGMQRANPICLSEMEVDLQAETGAEQDAMYGLEQLGYGRILYGGPQSEFGLYVFRYCQRDLRQIEEAKEETGGGSLSSNDGPLDFRIDGDRPFTKELITDDPQAEWEYRTPNR